MAHRVMFVASLLLACSAAHAQTPPPSAPAGARQELQFNDCMRTDRINEWAVVDNRTIAVRNGPDHFLIKTDVDCPRMDLGGGVHFKTSESSKAMGGMRICGGINEQIVRRDDPPCQIISAQKIDKAQFDALKKKAKRHGSGAEPNGAVH